ncbi:569_t:CDS:2 [Paraglomus brasilianum]|uniref:569_t:CDS:1 n=1 Tax=Paraglomus brasilianum TaxID=144538 RepID=A0A9N9BVA9_9GLOM|nr:569_t:CDS:2 [Paraglomus brasilianum]
MSTTEPSVEDVERFNTKQLIGYLRTKNLNLNNTDYKKIRDERVAGLDFLQLTREILRSEPYRFPDGPARRIETLVNSLNSQRLLSINEILSCIPPPLYYPPDTSTSISSTKIGGVLPTRITRWEGFLTEVDQYNFDEIERFERPQFFSDVEVTVETNVYTALEVNIFGVLNKVMKKYKFAKQKDSDFPPGSNIGPFAPDYTCRLKISDTFLKQILAIEIKRDILLQDLLEVTDSDLERFGRRELVAGHLYNIIGQIYNYMSSLQLQYGILSSYDNHWFLYRSKNNNTELHISHSLARDSNNPPVLKSYAYLVRLAEEDPTSPHHNITNSIRRQTSALQQSQQNSGSGQISQISRSLSNPHHNLRSTSGDQGSNENQDPTEEVFDCSEFKFECSLGYGQSGGTYQCKFYGQTLALKALDLYKNRRFFSNMQSEIKIYQLLYKIQGKYIPKLVCYGYYGGGMDYVMGMTIVGTMLSFHKIEKWQKNQALRALKIIHSNNILHNDIRKENILVNDEGNIFFIDFGKSIITDKKKLFRQEESELSRLLNYYM